MVLVVGDFSREDPKTIKTFLLRLLVFEGITLITPLGTPLLSRKLSTHLYMKPCVFHERKRTRQVGRIHRVCSSRRFGPAFLFARSIDGNDVNGKTIVC